MQHPPNRDILREKYRTLYSFTNDVIVKSVSSFHGKKVNSLPENISLFHFVRAHSLLNSINILCFEGYATDAMVLLRSLLNLYININWLTIKDLDSRMERYADFEVVIKKLKLDRISQRPNSNIQYNFDALNEKFNKLKTKYNLKNFRDFYNWSGKTIYDMAKEVDLVEDYDFLYRKLSEIEHTGPDSQPEYINSPTKEKITIIQGAKDKDIPLVLLTGLGYFLKTMAVVHWVFGIKFESIGDINDNYKQLIGKYKQNLTS